MRRFWLVRDGDATGISGTGVVAVGVQWPNGKAALSWQTEYTSVAVYDDLETVEAIHGHAGQTRVVWVDPDPEQDPRRNLTYAQAVARDCAGDPIDRGDLVMPVRLFEKEREPLLVTERPMLVEKGWRVQALLRPVRLGGSETGGSLGTYRADALRVVRKAKADGT